jgi:uncharacterized membrane protein SpoIIM required for sporulation
VIHHTEILASKVYEARADGVTGEDSSAEEFLADSAQAILLLQMPDDVGLRATYQRWVIQYRIVWRENFSLFLFTTILFIAGCLMGWEIGVRRQEYLTVLVPQPLLERILDHDPWFAAAGENPVFSGFMIAWNNIRVSLMAFVGSALLGLGGLYVLTYNGLLFGATLGFCASNGFDRALGNFVVGHGPLELTIIVASVFASFLLGRVFYLRPRTQFGSRFRAGFRLGGTVMAGVAPWLVLAAIIESFVSPQPFIPLWIRLGIGLTAAVLFWVWTFWPLPDRR